MIYSYSKEKVIDKVVLLRSSLDVDIDNSGNLEDTIRLDKELPFINELSKIAKKTIIIGHLGRPDGFNEIYSLKKSIYPYISSKITGIEFLDDLSSESIKKFRNSNSKVFLLENIRFFKAEESSNTELRNTFSKLLSSISDIFINNSFASYRNAVSTYDIVNYMPSLTGPNFDNEISALEKFKSNDEKPIIAILGGAKLEEKLDTLYKLGQSVDKILIGGAMAYTLLQVKGIQVGNSKIELDKVKICEDIISKYSEKIILPVDHLVSEMFDKSALFNYTDSVQVPISKIAIDIGLKTIELYKNIIESAKTILWNGPMGVYEWVGSDVGTKEIGKAVADSKAFTLVGGGDTISAINKFNLSGYNHISLGGGAMLKYLAQNTFPTLDIIKNQYE
ncbi:MAG: phosphoglycerate kinase [Candidatus Dojkabacteria bacterium]|nr:phosphoglycerate kinase [Candidatus Dojkabacteria bacterium]MDQ7020798.1 phosphoglycerate kinase [Candidatus Dojkabacteria bacterium]